MDGLGKSKFGFLSSSGICCLLALAALFLLLCFYYSPALSGESDFYISDCSYFFEPLCSFVRSELKQGQFPLWNPLLYCGMSQCATPSPSLFYPPSYFLFLLPFSQGLAVYMIFHHLLFAFAAFLLARQERLSVVSSCFACLAFGLASYFFVLPRNPTLPAVIAWLPLALFSLRQLGKRASRQNIACAFSLSLSSCMFILAGRPELFLLCFITLAIACFLASGDNGERPGIGLVAFRLALIACGIGLAGPALGPALEWLPLSPRSQGQALDDVLSWSANWYDLVSLVLAYPLGDLCDLSDRATMLESLVLSKPLTIPFIASAYLGPFIFQFAIFGFASKDFKFRFYWLGLLLFFLMLCLGSNSFLAPLLIKICPAFSVLRYPIKLIIFPVMILSFVSAIGLDSMLKRQISSQVLKASAFSWGALALPPVAVLIFPKLCLFAGEYYARAPYGSLVKDANISLALSAVLAIFVLFLLLFICFLYMKERISRKALAGLAISGLSASLFLCASSYPYFGQKGFYKRDSKLFLHLNSFLSQEKSSLGFAGRVLPFYTDWTLVPESFKKRNHSMGTDEQIYAYNRELGRHNSTLDFGCPQSRGYEAAATQSASDLFLNATEFSSQFLGLQGHPKPLSDLPIYRFCKLSATSYVLTQENLVSRDLPLPHLDSAYFELFGKSKGNNSRIYKVKNANPRFAFASSAAFFNDWLQVKNELLSLKSNRFDRESFVCFLDNQENIGLKETHAWLFAGGEISALASSKFEAASLGEIALPGSLKVLQDNGQEIVIEAESKRPEILLSADTFYPGWKLLVDGRESKIRQANLFLRAAALPAGKHRLEFRYEPLSLYAGTCAALASLLILLILTFVWFRTEPQAGAGTSA